MAAASSSSGAASSTGAAIAVAAAAKPEKGDELTEQILALQKEQKEMLAQKKRLQSDLRNARRKKTRLTKRARQLSDGDLIQILQMRDAKKKEDSAASSKEFAKDGKAPVAGAAHPDGHAAAPQPSQPEIGHFEDGEEEDK